MEEFRAIETEGNFVGVIREVVPIHHRFSQETPKPLEIRIQIITEDYHFVDIFLDFSNNYITNTRGGAPKTYSEQSFDTLAFLGLGEDLSRVSELVGKRVSFYTKKNAKGYLNAYLSKHAESKVPMKEAEEMLKAMLNQNKAMSPSPAYNTDFPPADDESWV